MVPKQFLLSRFTLVVTAAGGSWRAPDRPAVTTMRVKRDNRLGPDVRTRPGFSARPGAVGRRPSRFRRSDRGGSLCPDTRHALTLYMRERDPRPAVGRSTVEDRCPIGEGSLSDTGRALSFLNPTGTGSIEPALDGTIYPMSRPCPP